MNTKWSQFISAFVQPAYMSAFWIFFWANWHISVIPTWIAKLNKTLTHVHFLFESPKFTLYQNCPLTHRNYPNLRYKISITNHRHISKLSILIWWRKHTTTPTQYFWGMFNLHLIKFLYLTFLLHINCDKERNFNAATRKQSDLKAESKAFCKIFNHSSLKFNTEN